VLLDAPAPDVGTALAHHGYVQIDPIQVCGRMHDLILRNRVAGYREGDLMRHLHGETSASLEASARVALEHFVPGHGVLAAFPVTDWGWLRRTMEVRALQDSVWSGRLTAEEAPVADTVLREIEARGALGPDDFEDHRKVSPGWGVATLVKHTMQKLMFHGRLLIARREAGQRRVYDLPERVMPSAVFRAPLPDAEESLRWEALLRVRQRRLVVFKRAELARVRELVCPVTVDDGPTLHCLEADLPLFDATAAPPSARSTPRLLAPLDPLVYDRKVTSALWGFDYTWEVYTPPAKRTRGYYALPVLSGTALVGHVDPKADRAAGTLQVMGQVVPRGHAVTGAVAELARFLGLRPAKT